MKNIGEYNPRDQIEYVEKPWKSVIKIKKRKAAEKIWVVEDINPVISWVTTCDIPVNMDVTGT